MSDDKLIEELRARLWFASGELAAHGGFDNHCRALDEAADALAAKDTALSEMRNDRDAIKSLLTEEFRVSNDFATRLIAAEAALSEMRVELEQARAALEPFEELADEGNDDQPDETRVVVHAGRSIVYTLRLSDLRRARAAARALSSQADGVRSLSGEEKL